MRKRRQQRHQLRINLRVIGNFTGEADYLYQREVMAGNPKVYAQLVPLLSPFTHVIREGAGDVAAPAAAVGPDATESFVGAVAAPVAAPRKAPMRIRKHEIGRGDGSA